MFKGMIFIIVLYNLLINTCFAMDKTNYPMGLPANPLSYHPISDPGRIRNEFLFRTIYGSTKTAVETKLVTIFWMPGVFGYRYPLRVTTVNGVDKKLQMISKELEKLPTSDYKYLANPAGAFYWRDIAHTKRLSPHSFGIAIDINALQTNYWQWDLKKAGRAIKEQAPLAYHNNVPWEIVLIFEKHGFIWGGKWYHYDTMHFEYRPELLRGVNHV